MQKRGRPKKVRLIQKMPKVTQFSPRGRPGRPDEIELSLDQFEAIKLADFQGFDQASGALVMRISRASFGRILREARKKLADTLVNGKTLKIHMGDAQIGVLSKEFTLENLREEFKKYHLRNQELKREQPIISSLSLSKNEKEFVKF